MTVGATGGVATSPYTAAAGAATTKAGASNMASQLGTPNMFLKLLMVELEHQNPTSPMTPSSMLQQTAMLSQVEAITSMTKAVDQQQQASATTEATGLIGKAVTAVVAGKTVTGAVTDVSLTTTGTPTLDVGGVRVPLSSVTEVRAASSPTTSTPTITTATTATSTTGTSTGTTTA